MTSRRRLAHHREEHLQVIRSGHHRVRTSPARQELQVVRDQRLITRDNRPARRALRATHSDNDRHPETPIPTDRHTLRAIEANRNRQGKITCITGMTARPRRDRSSREPCGDLTTSRPHAESFPCGPPWDGCRLRDTPIRNPIRNTNGPPTPGLSVPGLVPMWTLHKRRLAGGHLVVTAPCGKTRCKDELDNPAQRQGSLDVWRSAARRASTGSRTPTSTTRGAMPSVSSSTSTPGRSVSS